MKDIFTKDELDSIYKEIRLNPHYMKHARRYDQYKKHGQIMQAALEMKIMKEIEVQAFELVAKERIDVWEKVKKVIEGMTDEDRHFLNVMSNSMRMIADVVEVFIMDTNSTLKRYGLKPIKEYDKLQDVMKEAKACVRTFDTLTKDEKVISLFGDSCDNLYKLIFNKASSFVNKVKKHEESINKKTARDAKVA